MGRTKSQPSFEWLTPPLAGKEKQVGLCRDLVSWCLEDPKLARGNKSFAEEDTSKFGNLTRADKIIRAISILANDSLQGSLDWQWAKNEVKQQGFDPYQESQRKLAFLVAKGCRATVSLSESLKSGTDKNQNTEGTNFIQSWKELMEVAICDLEFNSHDSYALFDAIFDNPKMLEFLGEASRIKTINGMEAELAAYWYLNEMGMKNVKFGGENDDKHNKIDITAEDEQGGLTFYQIKTIRGKSSQPLLFNVLNEIDYRECQSYFEKFTSNSFEVSTFRKSLKRFADNARFMMTHFGQSTSGARVLFMPIRQDKSELRNRVQSHYSRENVMTPKYSANALSLIHAEN